MIEDPTLKQEYVAVFDLCNVYRKVIGYLHKKVKLFIEQKIARCN